LHQFNLHLGCLNLNIVQASGISLASGHRLHRDEGLSLITLKLSSACSQLTGKGTGWNRSSTARRWTSFAPDPLTRPGAVKQICGSE